MRTKGRSTILVLLGVAAQLPFPSGWRMLLTAGLALAPVVDAVAG